MTITLHQLTLVFVYFIYGLGFFVMGIALTLESMRSPRLAESRVARPLALFGLLHGMHEWLEILLIQGLWMGVPFPSPIPEIRVIWLAISFIPLITFGTAVLAPERPAWQLHLSIFFGFGLAVFILAVVFYNPDPSLWIPRIDALARYTLALPGSLLAWIALRHRSLLASGEGRSYLGHAFQLSSLGFLVYGLTQIFVPKVDLFPGSLINVSLFSSLFGFPIQVIRAGASIVITIGLIRAIQFVERERDEQLLAAQKARLEAMEQVQKDLVEREALRRELLRHIVIAQEEERRRISRELHDETAQYLTAFSLNLASLEGAQANKRDLKQIVGRLQELCRQMSQGIYRMVHDLRPAQLDDLGLVPALQYLVDESRQSLGLQVSLSIEGERQRLDPLVETVIFRVAQEALSNVKRHAGVDRAELGLIYSLDQTVLQVNDRGCGFDPSQTLVPPHGWGLEGMRERVESVCGEMRIISAPGQGTCVEAILPFIKDCS